MQLKRATLSSGRFFKTMLVVFALSYCIIMSAYRSYVTKPLAYEDAAHEDVALGVCPEPRAILLSLPGFSFPEFIQTVYCITRTGTIFRWSTLVNLTAGTLSYTLATINAP